MSNDSSNYGALNRVLMMEYLWSDLSVVQEVLAKVAVLPTVIVEKRDADAHGSLQSFDTMGHARNKYNNGVGKNPTKYLTTKMMRIMNVCSFNHFEQIRCSICGVLRAMETGRVHVDSMIGEFDEGLHLVAFAPFHVANGTCSTGKDFAERVWTLGPNKQLIWQSCLKRLSQVRWSMERQVLDSVLMMDYLWSDMSVVQEVLADTAVLPTVIVEKLAWMTGCRRAWLAACVKKEI